MKVYIKAGFDNMPKTSNFFNAYQGFREMGIETILFQERKELMTSQKEDIVVGYVDTVRNRLRDFGIVTPDMDYPKELEGYLGRKIWKSQINYINTHPEIWPVFVNPIQDKKFTGVIVQSPADWIGCGSCYDNAEVLCSEIVNLQAECRVFVRYNKI